MSTRALRGSELTPDARIDAAKRKLADAIDDLVEARLAKGVAAREWINQFDSPLGKTRHLRLVKAGILKGVREGQLVLVRRAELDAYLETHAVRPPSSGDESELDAMVLRLVGRGA